MSIPSPKPLAAPTFTCKICGAKGSAAFRLKDGTLFAACLDCRSRNPKCIELMAGAREAFASTEVAHG